MNILNQQAYRAPAPESEERRVKSEESEFEVLSKIIYNK